MGVTIKDVAKEAGVSVTTTSYALNGTGYVSKEKKERIFDAAERLEYIPSGIARSLQAKQMGFVGYFAYSLSGPVYSELTKGIEDTFIKYEQDMVACCYSMNTKKLSRLLSEKMVDGAIIFSWYIESELLKRIADVDCPLVVLDRELYDKHISNILIDNIGSAYKVAEYIANLGFSDIGFIYGGGFDGDQRRKAFLEAAEKYKLKINQEWILDGDFCEKKAYTVVKQRIQTIAVPQVIFTFNDEMAIGTISALQTNGYDVPNDVSVIGMDDIPLATHVTPKLTTIHRPLYELGEMAAETLYKMVHEKQKSIKKIIPTYLIERESCARKK